MSAANGTNRFTAGATGNAVSRMFSGGPVLCDGAMGTMIYDRGISFDRCYDELSVSQPGTVASIHIEYLQAGAEMIETNTFGSTALRLERYGLSDKVREINLAAVRIARACVTQIVAQGLQICIAGAVGPLGVRTGPVHEVGLSGARTVFAEQISALAEGGPGVGVDLLMIETMTSLAEAGEAICAAREVAPWLRTVVMMTVDSNGNCLDGASPETAAERLTQLGADAVGCNCCDGPEAVLRAIKRMRGATNLPIAALPNAGLPRAVDGQSVYVVTPEDMADFARKAIRAGATLIGGCCGTTPDHTRAMKRVMRGVLHEDGTADDSMVRDSG